jgi:hypothetical protein
VVITTKICGENTYEIRMNNVKPIQIPLASHFNISSSLFPNNDKENDYMSFVPYVNAVESLMYVMVSIS